MEATTQQGQVATRLGTGHGWVDAAPFQAHLRFLIAVTGVSPEIVALLAGVSPRVGRRLLTGDGSRPPRRISPDTARRLYAVTPAVLEECRRRLVPAGPVTAAMAWMEVAGWCTERWSHLLRLDPEAVRALQDGQTGSCSYWIALQVRAEAVEVRARLVTSPRMCSFGRPARSPAESLPRAA